MIHYRHVQFSQQHAEDDESENETEAGLQHPPSWFRRLLEICYDRDELFSWQVMRNEHTIRFRNSYSYGSSPPGYYWDERDTSLRAIVDEYGNDVHTGSERLERLASPRNETQQQQS